MTLTFLPDPGPWPIPVTPRDTLNESASSAQDTQLSVAAENAPLRVIYGEVRLGPQIANVLAYGGNLVMLCIWGHGECDSVVSVSVDDKALETSGTPEALASGGTRVGYSSSVTATHYMGTAGQTADPTLIAAFAAQTPTVTYTDNLPDICYSVFQVPVGASAGFPRTNAVIKGRKIYDPLTLVTAWSDNPALCLADFITNATYGCARSVEWASVASVAADCDYMIGTDTTEKTRTLNLALETVQPVTNWLDTLRTYAGCWIVPDGSSLKLISDKASSSTASEFAHLDSSILSISALKKRGVQSTPTVMTVTYTDTSKLPYSDSTAVRKHPGVDLGTTPRRESQVSLPGITRYSQAYREATERLNKLAQNDLSCTLTVFDEALALEIGDIVTVTHPIGLTDKLMRIVSLSGEYGRYSLNLVEYDYAVYSADVLTAPTYPDTTLTGPANPKPVTDVTMTEEFLVLQNGTTATRWRVTWTKPDYLFTDYYRCELWTNSKLVQSAHIQGEQWPTGALTELIAQSKVWYQVKIYTVSISGQASAVTVKDGEAQGKYLLPSNVLSVSAFEAGGRVYLSWEPAVDVDIWKYEVRYGTASPAVDWDNAKLIDRTDALRLQTDLIPEGIWEIQVKAIDSVGGYSPIPAKVTVTVTSDANSFLIDTHEQTEPTMTYMTAFTLARDDPKTYYVTDDDVVWNNRYTNPLNVYGSALATHSLSITGSGWQGEVTDDWGTDLTGQWTGTANVESLSGTHTSEMGFSLTSSRYDYTFLLGLSHKRTARSACFRHQSQGAMLITVPDSFIRLDAVPREEVGSGETPAGGYALVSLENDFVAVKKLTVTAIGNTARYAVADDIQLDATPNTFRVYVFDNAGNKIFSAFQYSFQGV